ncbi:UNVERIFIED_CONTAM: hypothetical protein GTU68_065732 [Idotea baltica]|nr:hypothetical protein [Idotea baltica]
MMKTHHSGYGTAQTLASEHGRSAKQTVFCCFSGWQQSCQAGRCAQQPEQKPSRQKKLKSVSLEKACGCGSCG